MTEGALRVTGHRHILLLKVLIVYRLTKMILKKKNFFKEVVSPVFNQNVVWLPL